MVVVISTLYSKDRLLCYIAHDGQGRNELNTTLSLGGVYSTLYEFEVDGPLSEDALVVFVDNLGVVGVEEW